MIGFADLEDAGEWGDAPPAPAADTAAQSATREVSGGAIVSRNALTFTEECGACRGSGTFYSYAGRPVGPCFKCKGTGERTYRTSPEQRVKARASAAKRKVTAADAKISEAATWLESNPERAEFLAQTWGFPVSLRAALDKYGSLTSGQLAAVDKCIAGQAVKAEARKADASDLDLSALPSGRYAVPDGDTRLKVYVNNVDRGKWSGWIFVSDGAEYGQGQRYGSQRPGENYTGKITSELETIKRDPMAASIAYGQLMGVCGVCNRTLENETSVAAGIGPICAAKLGAL